MSLMSVERWLEKYFVEGDRPSMQTVRRCLRARKIPGQKIGGAWYINEALWLASNNPRVARVLAS